MAFSEIEWRQLLCSPRKRQRWSWGRDPRK